MTIALQCDQCGKAYALKAELAGKAVKCRGCGKVLRVPDRPVRPAPRARAQAAVPRTPTPASSAPPDLDPYGLSDEPERSSSAPEIDDDLPPPARIAATTRPRTREEQKAFEKRVAARDRQRPSFTQPAFGVSFGAVLAIALFGARIYLKVTRPFRNHQQVEASAPEMPGPGSPLAEAGPVVMPSFPELGPGSEVESGIRFYKVAMGAKRPGPGVAPGHGMRLWLYLPPGDHAPGSLPCVLIAPAGSILVTGNGLDEGQGDHPEHLPYVRAGFAVLAYSLDGEQPDSESATLLDLRRASETFLAARAGLTNASIAMEWLKAKVPQVDPSRLYTAGHSSAGTMALVLAENDDRIEGCVAFAPCTDISRRFDPAQASQLRLAVPRLDAFFTTYNPKANEASLECPVFLFHARDDSNVPVGETEAFAADLKRMGKPVTLVTVPTGDHYDAMIRQGIPRAVEWLKALDEAR